MLKQRAIFVLLLTTILLGSIISCSDSSSTNGPAPQISSISPGSAPVGYMVVLNGSNFGSSGNDGKVTFGGATVAESDIVSWSSTMIKLFIPQNAVSGKVFVTTKSVKGNEVDFTITTKGDTDPWIQTTDMKIAQPTQKIGIYGKNFGSTQGTSFVEFNGLKAISYTSWTDTKITVVVPEGATSGKIVAFINGKSTNGVDFTVQQPNQIVSMVTVPAGQFTMGTNDNADLDNSPAHKVTISSPFLMAKTEITQKQWKTVMDNSNPSQPNDLGDDKPVQQVTFIRAIDFCNRLSKMEGRTQVYTVNGDNVTCDWNANGYRLPTEAEWEYAARAGSSGEFSLTDILSMAWCSANAQGHIKPSGSKTPNAFGLYDMLGNVYEMCWDFYDADYYKTGDKADPRGPSPVTTERVMRGGSFINDVATCGSLKRASYPSTNDNFNFNLGFRVVRKAN